MKTLKLLIKVAITVALVGLLVVIVDWQRSWEVARSIHIGALGVFATVIVSGILISTYKWKLLAREAGFDFPYFRYVRWYIAGTFVNNFLPSIVGGDTYRALSLGKIDNSRSSAAASVLFDRYTGLVGMAVLACVFALMNIVAVFREPFWLALFIGAIAGVIAQGVALPGRRWSISRLLNIVAPKKGMRLGVALERYGSWPILLRSFGWGMVFAFLGVGIANYILFWALGVEMGLVEFLSVIFFINIISALPLSINNIGLKEWAYFVFFGFLGVAPEVSVTAAIISRLVQMVISLLGITTFFAKKHVVGETHA